VSLRRTLGEPSPELDRARRLLADGAWHDYEQVIRQLIKIIPPGRAIREAEKLRVAQARKRARYASSPPPEAAPRRSPPDLDRLRETGARSIVRKMLNGAHFEITPPGRGRRRIRLPRRSVTPGR
jgi:hypothetical protein